MGPCAENAHARETKRKKNRKNVVTRSQNGLVTEYRRRNTAMNSYDFSKTPDQKNWRRNDFSDPIHC